MIRNYLKIAFRNLTRNKVYSFINIAGLATGMAVALLIGLWVRDELCYNHAHLHYDRLAVVLDTQVLNGASSTDYGIDVPLAEELRSRYGSDFKHLALSSGYENHIVTAGNKKMEKRCRWVGAELPAMLTLHMLEGSDKALQDPSSVLLTASTARTLFGNADPIGQILRVDNNLDFKVAGVYEDLPANTVFHFVDFLLPWDKYAETHSWIKNTQHDWGNYFAMLYAEVNSPSDFQRINARIRHIPEEHLRGSKETIFLHPMDKWRLYNEFKDGQVSGGPIRFVWLFGGIALAVLLLACINFMNLSTARSERRAREVGIRKTLGSGRGQLVRQFLGESVMMALFSLAVAFLLASLLLPLFNHLAKKELTIPWNQPECWLLALGFALFTGLVSGSYPAFYLSAFQPVKVLKGALRAGRQATLPRKVLVVVQFTVSVILIMGTLIVYRQIQFARNRPIGYQREGLLTVNILNNPGLKPHFNAIRNDLVGSAAAIDVMGSNSSQTSTWTMRGGFTWKGQDPYSRPQFGWVSTTHDYGRTIRWQVLEGHAPVPGIRSDSLGIMMNESAVKLAGFRHPIGQVITVDSFARTVIAVVKDMVMDSPFEPPMPTLFHMDYSWMNYITMRLNGAMPRAEAITRIQNVFKKYDPDGLVSYDSPEETYGFKFAVEQRIGAIATFFTVLAIFISCLGLFGLASFVAEQRTREIGVRKVLGASVFNIWSTLSQEFIFLVLIACVIAIPISVYFLHQWLQQYAYRTSLSWWLFAAAVGGALLVTLLTVSYQTIRAALMNPVRSLKTE